MKTFNRIKNFIVVFFCILIVAYVGSWLIRLCHFSDLTWTEQCVLLEDVAFAFLCVSIIYLVVKEVLNASSIPRMVVDENCKEKELTKIGHKISLASNDQVRYNWNRYKHNKKWKIDFINTEMQKRLEGVDEIIVKHASYVFMISTVSQSGRFDSIISICTNMRMIKHIVNAVGFRPNIFQQIKLYTCVIGASFVSYLGQDISETADDNLDTLLANIGVEDEEVINVIGKVTGSLLDGVFNALTTLTIGYMTVFYLKYGSSAFNSVEKMQDTRREVRKEAFNILCSKIIVDNTIDMLAKLVGKAWDLCSSGKALKITKTTMSKIMDNITESLKAKIPFLGKI